MFQISAKQNLPCPVNDIFWRIFVLEDGQLINGQVVCGEICDISINQKLLCAMTAIFNVLLFLITMNIEFPQCNGSNILVD